MLRSSARVCRDLHQVAAEFLGERQRDFAARLVDAGQYRAAHGNVQLVDMTGRVEHRCARSGRVLHGTPHGGLVVQHTGGDLHFRERAGGNKPLLRLDGGRQREVMQLAVCLSDRRLQDIPCALALSDRRHGNSRPQILLDLRIYGLHARVLEGAPHSGLRCAAVFRDLGDNVLKEQSRVLQLLSLPPRRVRDFSHLHEPPGDVPRDRFVEPLVQLDHAVRAMVKVFRA